MIDVLAFLFFVFGCAYIVHSKKAKNQVEYVSAGKKTALFPLVATLVMTEVNPMALIAMTSLGYTVGYLALYMAGIAFVSPLFASFTTAKKWKNFDASCITSLFDTYLGTAIGNIVRFILLLSLTVLSATYLKGMIIFSEVLLPNIPSSMIITAVLVFCVLSVVYKGLNGIIRMDIVGLFLTVFLIGICLVFSFYAVEMHDGSPIKGINFAGSAVLPATYLIALCVLQLMMYSIAPWWGQKLFSAKNTKTAYKASMISAFVLFCFYAAIILSAIYLRKYGISLSDSDLAFPTVIATFPPLALKSLYVIAFFYIGTTTICGVWSSMVGMITSGFLQYGDLRSPKMNYLVWVLLGIMTYCIASYSINSVLHAAVLAVMQICSIYFSVMAIFYLKRLSKIGCVASIFTSIAIGYCTYFILGEEGNYIWYWTILGIPMMFLSGYVLSGIDNIFKNQKQAVEIK